MKNKLWLFQVPLVLLFTGAFYISELGYRGQLESHFLREKVYSAFKRMSGALTDTKFRIRGYQEPKNNIVIVEVDSEAIDTIGRWPWHREYISKLIENTFNAGAKVVGLDIVFSEADPRVPEQLATILQAQNLGGILPAFDTDKLLADTITRHADQLVLGYASEAVCSPHFDGPQGCPVDDPDAIKAIDAGGGAKYALTDFVAPAGWKPADARVLSMAQLLENMPLFQAAGKHAGYFYAHADPDGTFRRSPLALLANGKPLPSLPLEMARIGLGEELGMQLGADSRLQKLWFKKSGEEIPVSPLGFAEVNYRGPQRHFKYLPALDVLRDEDQIQDRLNRKLAGLSRKEVLKDAYVLIGISALGVFDMRAFPFDPNTPGVEGHATVLDNLLSHDLLVRWGDARGPIYMFLLMTVGALLFGFAAQKLESVPALLMFIAVFSGLGVADVKLLFAHGINWDTTFLYMEIFTIFACTLAAKYILEERSKKFVKGAFAKYVAPAVVDSILKDPAKLTVGGEKRELTILFSDIRSFTTFSEKMDAKALSSFLNDYLGIMTEIVFKNNGTLDKYIGDAVMAFWGAPLADPKHAHNCVKAATEMMQALAANKERFKTQYGVDVAVGVGFNSGQVSVGNMGSQNNFSYTVIGDNVNLASRLEGLTKAYGVSIVTSRFTFDAIHGAGEQYPPHRVLDFVKVKGKKKAVELIQVLDVALPAEGLKLFDEGRALYSKQQWDAATEKFRAANEILGAVQGGKDGPSEEYLVRCEDFKKNPPGEGWDGSWEMHSK